MRARQAGAAPATRAALQCTPPTDRFQLELPPQTQPNRPHAQIIIDGFALPARWRLRHIPGPAPTWLFGHTLECRRHNLFLFKMWAAMGERYGKVFKWFWATQPIITVRGERQCVLNCERVRPVQLQQQCQQQPLGCKRQVQLQNFLRNYHKVHTTHTFTSRR